MANELSASQQSSLATIISSGKIEDLIKPLIKEIFLFSTHVAGTTHLSDPTPLETIAVGDKLSLRREDNIHDDLAILILNSQGKKIGYVPKQDNPIFARLMDAGKLLKAQIASIERKNETYRHITIDVLLVDV